MTQTDEKLCPVCGSDMKDKGFSGDWKIHECSDKSCGTKIESTPTKNPTGDGFTMESLELASKYASNH